MINLEKPPVDISIINENGKVWKAWLDFFLNLGSFFSGTYYKGDGYEITPRKISIYQTVDSTVNSLSFEASGEGLLIYYDVDSGQEYFNYTNSSSVTLPPHAGKMVIQGILKRS